MLCNYAPNNIEKAGKVKISRVGSVCRQPKPITDQRIGFPNRTTLAFI
jgi:hypothetical protein